MTASWKVTHTLNQWNLVYQDIIRTYLLLGKTGHTAAKIRRLAQTKLVKSAATEEQCLATQQTRCSGSVCRVLSSHLMRQMNGGSKDGPCFTLSLLILTGFWWLNVIGVAQRPLQMSSFIISGTPSPRRGSAPRLSISCQGEKPSLLKLFCVSLDIMVETDIQQP